VYILYVPILGMYILCSLISLLTNVGSMRDLDVIDVSQQEDFKMKMRHWTEYYESRPRRKVLNVISLEFSDTSYVCAV
jgi:hypothetical protein